MSLVHQKSDLIIESNTSDQNLTENDLELSEKDWTNWIESGHFSAE